MTRQALTVLVRLLAGAAGLWLAWLAVVLLVKASRDTDTRPALLLALAVLSAVPAGALLWFAVRGRLGVWDDHS